VLLVILSWFGDMNVASRYMILPCSSVFVYCGWVLLFVLFGGGLCFTVTGKDYPSF